ncbi:tyrosine-type recombinase/integrase [Streptomyces sp. H10-C2]|uniref:tyrosine-type recombinase/integrase n=1 Tax=unclassified Streptomyces TaxID=2593676 RepID=UPI0024BA5BA7|nr:MULTISPECIES: tyrosine-type recombinase/integrase [unclassified Streptomyces]MDJ0342177.1 tyrosine-type recombinase/integrase [Streptomyces sp. PH10-H1]MDJ0368691.1 tyrosine-type recombinase/integrase [Streptomyces sp. H10-C2]
MAHAERRWSKKAKRWYWRVKFKLPNGKWGSASVDDFGNRFTTEALAEKYGHAQETDVDRQVFINRRDGDITVAAWSKLWLDSIDVGPLSEKEYRLRTKNHVLPEWGTVKVRDLSAVSVAAWEKGLRKQLSKNYADGVISTFRTMMDDAVKNKLRGDNPVASRKSGRRGKYVPKTKAVKVTATPRQVLLIARNASIMRGFNEYVLVLTAAYTGQRIGELAALHRDQLELTDAGAGFRMHVTHQSQYVEGEFVEIDAKYDSGRGLIIPRFLAELLQQLVDSRPDSEWVFSAPKGGRLIRGGEWYAETWRHMVNGRAPRPVVRGAKARTGVPPVLGVAGLVPHGMRHSQKVWLDEGDLPRVAVEARMGHVLPGVEGTYSHVTLVMELRIAEHLQSLWEDSLRVVIDRREYGPFPPLETARRKRSPRNRPKDL